LAVLQRLHGIDTQCRSFSQVVFDFAVTGELIMQGLIAAVFIGIIGGLFPAIRAVRVPVSTALREL